MLREFKLFVLGLRTTEERRRGDQAAPVDVRQKKRDILTIQQEGGGMEGTRNSQKRSKPTAAAGDVHEYSPACRRRNHGEADARSSVIRRPCNFKLQDIVLILIQVEFRE